jgi:hypothetical protein
MSGSAPIRLRSSGVALSWRAWEGKPDTGRLTHCESHAQARIREDSGCLVDYLAEGLGGAGSMWRAEWSQGDIQLTIADTDFSCTGEQLVQQGSPLRNNFGLQPPRSNTTVTRCSPTRLRTSPSNRGKALVNAALISPVITSNGSPELSLIQ